MKTRSLLPVIIAAIVIGVLHLTGCAVNETKDPGSSATMENMELPAVPNETEALCDKVPAIPEKSNADKARISTVATDEKVKTVSSMADKKTPSKIIKTAEVSMQVKNVKSTRKSILEIIKKCEAYVSSENQANSTGSIEDDMVIRIKPEGFDDIIDRFLEQSIYTDYRKITAEDVTTYYIDTEARLKSKKEVETQYSDILKKATTIADIMEVEEKLRVIREEIEATEGRLKYLNDQVSYSTVDLHFYEKLEYQAAPAPGSGFFYQTGKAFKGGWQSMLTFFLAVIYLWPVWLILAVTIFLMVRMVKKAIRKRRLRKVKQASPAVHETS
jgi:hypothetical protein